MHANPINFFQTVFTRLKTQNNFITFVSESLRYFSDLDFDVLNFCLLDSLSETREERIGADMMSIAPWLNNMSQFAATVCKKQERLDLEPILHYVTNRIADGQVYDLYVFNEILGQMSGTRFVDEVGVDQMDVLAAGDCLRRSAFVFEPQKYHRRSGNRLAIALRDTGVAGKLVVLSAIRKQDLVFDEERMPLKVLSWLNDQVGLDIGSRSMLCQVGVSN